MSLALLAGLHAWPVVADETQIDVPAAAALALAAALVVAALLRATAATGRAALAGAIANVAGALLVALAIVGLQPGWRATALLALLTVALVVQGVVDVALRAASSPRA